MPSTASRIAGDSIVSAEDEKGKDFGNFLLFQKNTIKVKSHRDLEENIEADTEKEISEDLNGWNNLCRLAKTSSSNIKKAFGLNVHFIASKIYPGIKNHIRRMNSKVFSDVPQDKDSKCYNSPAK
ncbi:MAG: hypothetical protein EBS55_12465 [Flavobacteriaceae bacterium]|nr:hypothetical protein [Flavobacteriaceae bacterium]